MDLTRELGLLQLRMNSYRALARGGNERLIARTTRSATAERMPAKRFHQITLDDHAYNALKSLKRTETESFGKVIAKLIKETKRHEYVDRFSLLKMDLERGSVIQNIPGSKMESGIDNCEYLNCFNKATTEVNIRPLGLTPHVCDEHITTLKVRYRHDISERRL
jgi:predicted CopG family antitoxin